MKAILKSGTRAMVAIVIVVLATITVNAQFNIGGPGTNGSGINANGTQSGGPSPTPSVPFDGGMSLMLAASGIGYVAKKLKRRQQH